MSEKSHVSLSQKVCLVCGKEYADGVLLHKQLRKTLEPVTFSGYGFCEEHQAEIDQGNVFLIEVSNPSTGAEKMSLMAAQRTGRVLTVAREVLKHILKQGFVTDDSPPFMLAETSLIDELVTLFNQTPTEDDTVH